MMECVNYVRGEGEGRFVSTEGSLRDESKEFMFSDRVSYRCTNTKTGFEVSGKTFGFDVEFNIEIPVLM